MNKERYLLVDPLVNNFLNKNGNLSNLLALKEILCEMVLLRNKLKSIHSRKNISCVNKVEFFRTLDNFFLRAEQFELDINDVLLTARLKSFFRKFVSEYLFKSAFPRRGLIKPRGYPGDYMIVEAMYDNKPTSSGIGYLLDQYFLQNDYVQAVRDRKDKTKDVLREYISSAKKDKLIVLNLACGSCRELRELFEEGFSTGKKIDFLLVDQDATALKFAKRELEKLKLKQKFHYFQKDVLGFLKEYKVCGAERGNLHFIYSIGLADYLPNSIFGPLLKHGFNLLADGSEFFVAHKNTAVSSSPVSDWGADWKFIPRTHAEVKKLARDFIKDESLKSKIIFDDKGLLFYLILSKT